MELITGRVHGFYLACYTVATREGHFGYAKICTDRPESVWQPGNALRKIAVGPYADEKEALLAVRVEGERRLAARLANSQPAHHAKPAKSAPHPAPLPRTPCPTS